MTTISEIVSKKAVIFARVSSREQELGQSIDAQLQNLQLVGIERNLWKC